MLNNRHKPVQVIAVTGGKGGVGKSNIALNLCVAMAKLNKKMILFDADFGLANIDVLLGLGVKKNLFNVLQGECSLQDICLEGPAGITVIPAASGVQKMTALTLTEQASVIHAFSTLQGEVDAMIIDTAAGISNNVLNFVQCAEEIVIVVCHEATSITDAYAMIKLLNKNHKITRFRILVNMVQDNQEGQMVYHKLKNVALRFLDVNLFYFGYVPYDEYLKLAVRQHQPVVLEHPGAKSAVAFTQLALTLSKWPTATVHDGKLAFFFERLLKPEQSVTND